MNPIRRHVAPSRPLCRGWDELLPPGYTGQALEEPEWRRLNELLFERCGNLIKWLVGKRIAPGSLEEEEDFLQEVLITNMRILKNRTDVFFRINLFSWLNLMVMGTMREHGKWRQRAIVDFHGTWPARPGVRRQTKPWSLGPRWDSFRNMSIRNFDEI